MQDQYTAHDLHHTLLSDRESAFRWLFERGAHFVLARENKKPLWPRWNERRPTLQQVLKHNGPIGIIPASIGATVLDADNIPSARNLTELVGRIAHIAIVRSRRPDRAHIFIRDDTSRTNGRFSAFGVTGDIRSGSGYVILWGDAPQHLVRALVRDDDTPGSILNIPQFEHWIVTRGAGARRRRGPRRERTRLTNKPNPHLMNAGATPSADHLESVPVGRRNNALFYTLRHWAYARKRGECWTDWQSMIRQCARWLNTHFPTPLPKAEVDATADSVASFCWDQLQEVVPNPYSTTSDDQARRGRASGAVRRQNSGHLSEDPEPWIALGISRSRYYEIRKAYREEHDGREPSPEDFRRQTPEEAVNQRRQAARISADRRRKARPEPHHKQPDQRRSPKSSKAEAGRKGGLASGAARRRNRGEEHPTPWTLAGKCRSAWYQSKPRTEAPAKRRARAGRNRNQGGRGHGGDGGRGAGPAGDRDKPAPAATASRLTRARSHTATKPAPTPAQRRRDAVSDLIASLQHGDPT